MLQPLGWQLMCTALPRRWGMTLACEGYVSCFYPDCTLDYSALHGGCSLCTSLFGVRLGACWLLGAVGSMHLGAVMHLSSYTGGWGDS